MSLHLHIRLVDTLEDFGSQRFCTISSSSDALTMRSLPEINYAPKRPFPSLLETHRLGLCDSTIEYAIR